MEHMDGDIWETGLWKDFVREMAMATVLHIQKACYFLFANPPMSW